jgi:hypothetical protein
MKGEGLTRGSRVPGPDFLLFILIIGYFDAAGGLYQDGR